MPATRRSGVDDIPAIERQAIADAVRAYYNACAAIDGASVQHLTLHSEIDDAQPLTALLLVTIENKYTGSWVETVNSFAERLWDQMCAWEAIGEEIKHAADDLA